MTTPLVLRGEGVGKKEAYCHVPACVSEFKSVSVFCVSLSHGIALLVVFLASNSKTFFTPEIRCVCPTFLFHKDNYLFLFILSVWA